MNGKEPIIYSWEDDACGPSTTVLIKKFHEKDTIGAITYEGLCWGDVYSYYEIKGEDTSSIKLVSEVSSGRSEHFQNWSSTINTGPKPEKAKLNAIAEKILH